MEYLKSVLDITSKYWYLIIFLFGIVGFYIKRFYQKKDENKKIQPRFYENGIGFVNGTYVKYVICYDHDAVILDCTTKDKKLKILTKFGNTIVKPEESIVIKVEPSANYNGKDFKCKMKYKDIQDKVHTVTIMFKVSILNER